MSAKMGRPKLENPNSVRTSVRLDVNTDKQLSDYCEKTAFLREKLFVKLSSNGLNIKNKKSPKLFVTWQ